MLPVMQAQAAEHSPSPPPPSERSLPSPPRRPPVWSWALNISSTVAFAAALAIIVAISFVANRNLQRLSVARVLVTRTEQVLDALATLQLTVTQAQAHTRGFFITGDESFLRFMSVANTRSKTSLDDLQRLTADNPLQQKRVQHLGLQVQESLRWYQVQSAARRAGQPLGTGNGMVAYGEDLMEKLASACEEFAATERSMLQERERVREESALASFRITTFSTVTSLLILMGVLYRLNRTELRRVRAEVALHLLNLGLEERVRARTAELHKANSLKDAIFNSAHFSSIATDDRGIIQIFNVGAEHMLGYSAAEILNKLTPAELSDPQEITLRAAALSAEFGTPITAGFQALVYKAAHAIEDIYELTYIRKDGTRLPAIVSVTALRDAQGGIIGYLLVGTDMTARHQAEQARQVVEARYRALVENLSSAMIVHGADSSIVFSNAMASTLLGLSDDQLRGRVASDPRWGFIQEDGTPLPLQRYPVNRVLESGEALHGQIIGVSQPQLSGPIWALCNAYPVRNSQGRIEQVVVTFTNITEQKQAQEAVRLLNASLEQRVLDRTAELEAANRELEAFSYSVSHDLRSPLRAMDGFSMALLEDNAGNLDATSQDYLHRIRAGSQRMAGLIDDLLSLAHLSREPLRHERVDLSALAREIGAELEQQNPGRSVELVVAPALVAMADERMLRVVLTNLLGNAWKFTGHQPRARIEVGTREQSGEQVFFVSDNGAGFDPAYAGKLFGAFQRLHSTQEFKGNGIGLALVQRIVRRHGGRVWAEGAVGQGATFHFTLGKKESKL